MAWFRPFAGGTLRALAAAIKLHNPSTPIPEDFAMTSSQTYLLGFIILVLGLAVAAYMISVPPVWIAVGVIVLIGIGIMAAASRSGSGDV